ncbi:hypothetical protein AACH06_27405 [Ideonella sp. DXS29W]|uniref:Uncharacterized protein n=1 Tax=Ideonella lacteola TaxID=2984193 RepID=A0ABU9BZK4_9BURK
MNRLSHLHHIALPQSGSRVAARAAFGPAGLDLGGKRAHTMNLQQSYCASRQAEACLGYEDWLSPPGEGGA